jgi:electron-transferring-flavoprotein dehydrogenase
LDRDHQEPGHEAMEKLSAEQNGHATARRYKELRFDKKLTFDKVTDVYHAAVGHDEDQPAHLHVLDTNICATRCTEEYGNPCQRFCPAAVYEMVEVVPQAASLRGGNGVHSSDLQSEPSASAAGSGGNPTVREGADGNLTVREGAEAKPRRQLQINFSNCVHCKTCDIMDPYQIINWVTPEGGGGPDYVGM